MLYFDLKPEDVSRIVHVAMVIVDCLRKRVSQIPAIVIRKCDWLKTQEDLTDTIKELVERDSWLGINLTVPGHLASGFRVYVADGLKIMFRFPGGDLPESIKVENMTDTEVSEFVNNYIDTRFPPRDRNDFLHTL